MSELDALDALAAEAERIERALSSCPAVAGLADADGVALHLRGRRVPGLRVDDASVEVHVRARWGSSVHDVERQTRSALAPIVAGRELSLHIDDVELPADAGVT